MTFLGAEKTNPGQKPGFSFVRRGEVKEAKVVGQVKEEKEVKEAEDVTERGSGKSGRRGNRNGRKNETNEKCRTDGIDWTDLFLRLGPAEVADLRDQLVDGCRLIDDQRGAPPFSIIDRLAVQVIEGGFPG